MSETKPIPESVADAVTTFVGTMLLRIAREEWAAEQESKRSKRRAA
jgi:hypothetical protein